MHICAVYLSHLSLLFLQGSQFIAFLARFVGGRPSCCVSPDGDALRVRTVPADAPPDAAVFEVAVDDVAVVVVVVEVEAEEIVFDLCCFGRGAGGEVVEEASSTPMDSADAIRNARRSRGGGGRRQEGRRGEGRQRGKRSRDRSRPTF